MNPGKKEMQLLLLDRMHRIRHHLSVYQWYLVQSQLRPQLRDQVVEQLRRHLDNQLREVIYYE